MNRSPARPLIAGLLGALLTLSLSGAAGATTTSAVVTVGSSEFVYTDLTKPGRLVISGTGSRSQTVEHVALGFNAYRSVDAGEDDRAHVQDVSAHVDVQQVTVLVDVITPGDLTVVVRGLARDDLDPRPVADSAVPVARETGRGFVWTIPDATPGIHRFAAALAPNAGPGAAARFVPEVTVERSSRERSYARHLRGELGAPSAVMTTNRLRLSQIAADVAAPDITVPPLREPAESPRTYAKALSTEMTLVANGPHAPLDPPVEVKRALQSRDHVSYEALTVLTTAGEYAVSGRKADWAFTHKPFVGWDYHLATARLTPPADGRPQQPPAPLYEGDAAQVGALASFAPYSTSEHDAKPASGGRLIARGPAHFADAVDYLTHNEVGGFEPNRTDVEALQDPRALWRAGLTSATSLALLVEGGDIDNRGGETAIHGDDVFIANPTGFTPFAARIFAGTTGDPLPIEFDTAISRHGLTITPRVDPGRFALESQPRADGVEDWATHLLVVIFYSPEWAQEGPAAPVITQHVPAGVTATARVVTSDGERRQVVHGAGDHVMAVGD